MLLKCIKRISPITVESEQASRNYHSRLTAFVVRSFQRARQFMDIDESVLQLSVDFLLDHQSEDGAYIENGRVSNSMLKVYYASTYLPKVMPRHVHLHYGMHIE